MFWEILTEDLDKKHLAAKFVPWFMSLEQKEICTEVAQDLSEIANNDPYFPQKVIAGDGYDP